MIIHQPEIFQQENYTIVWAKIEFANTKDNFPEYLWYRIPDSYAEFVSLQSDAFLVPGLLGGMYFGEDIEVRGTISPQLAYHLDEYQFNLHIRMQNDVRPVNVKYARLKPLEANPRAVGATFSGGVDSLFTLWGHLPHSQMIQDYQITHVLFINGFDILNKDRDKYQSLFPRYQEELKGINVDLVPLETNLVSIIIPRLNYIRFYGPVLVGCAHVLGGLFKKFIISSSWAYEELQLRGTSSEPLTDMLLSTESLELVHYGSTHRRVEKIKEIGDWGFVQRNLRVCPHKNLDTNFMNCSRCEKCVRTMLPLYALGIMDKFETFAKPLVTNWDVLWWARKFNPSTGFVYEMFPFVKEHKLDLLPWLIIAASLGYVRHGLLKMIPKFVRKWLRRFGYFLDPHREKYAFDNADVIQKIQSSQRYT